MKELVEMLAKSLVDVPEKVVVKETVGDNVIVIEIEVEDEDVGKIIGKEGRIANAIRTIAKASGAKNGKKVTVEIMSGNQHS